MEIRFTRTWNKELVDNIDMILGCISSNIIYKDIICNLIKANDIKYKIDYKNKITKCIIYFKEYSNIIFDGEIKEVRFDEYTMLHTYIIELLKIDPSELSKIIQYSYNYYMNNWSYISLPTNKFLYNML